METPRMMESTFDMFIEMISFFFVFFKFQQKPESEE